MCVVCAVMRMQAVIRMEELGVGYRFKVVDAI